MVTFLPGPMTVQKLSCVDDKMFDEGLIDLYSQLLSSIVRTVFPSWLVFKEEIVHLYTVEESFALSHEILSLLCGFLKNESEKEILRAIAFVLVKYVKSDAVLTAILECSSIEIKENTQKYQQQSEWENYVQLLATLPERVANRLETETPKELSHESFSYKLVFHVLRAIDYMSESSYHALIQYDLYYISHLLSKVLINYNMGGSSDAILKLVDVLIGWCAYDNSASMFVRRKLIQTMLNHLNRQAVDCLSLMLLNRCPIDYRSREQAIYKTLGDNLNTSRDWNEILTHRVPFYMIPRDYRLTNIQENLVYYVAMSEKAPDVLADLILRLAAVWSDVKMCNVSNIPQHMYISQLLVLAVKYRVVMVLKKIQDWNLFDIKNILFKGMTRHLNVITQEFRCIGMATVEIILKTLAQIENSDKETLSSLNFEYNDMPENCKEINNILNEIVTKCLIDDTRRIHRNYKANTVDFKGVLDLIANKVIDHEEFTAPVQNTIVTCAVKTPQTTKEIVKTIISVKLDDWDRKEKQQAEELDSDDDLQPYDMSNDVSVSAKVRPNYLRDLLEMLVEAKDAETFEACLEVAEELVDKQLKTEDRKLTEDLLSLFVHLDGKYHVDDFEHIKFNTVVAMVCCQPRICAEYLCREFHTDVGRYSIATKIFMLDVLAEAVNRIADLKPHVEDKLKEDIQVRRAERPEEVPAEEIIRRRLINKTRYFHSIRPHPFANAKRNLFAAVSDYFFYPLVSGFGCKQLTLSHHNLKQDVDSILMLKYLTVVGNVILASKNCPKCSSYCWEILQILSYMRYTPDPKIKMAVISLLASVVVALPAFLLRTEFLNVMLEFRTWLTECVCDVDLAMKFGGPKSEAGMFAAQVLYLIENTLTQNN
ncbi:unnamed protein product [Diatraea saccharalis]|uniref:Telomere length regulation protein conserved domain-containing protein n=1 Tax=Diatraea saccharalis TaxID=40085 RepID=A0A9N9RDP2_9NEOP|nr:unnamed protein product [Diatraea saccharalis]